MGGSNIRIGIDFYSCINIMYILNFTRQEILFLIFSIREPDFMYFKFSIARLKLSQELNCLSDLMK